MTESFCALVGKMEQASSACVFEKREMHPLSPDGVDVDWSIIAAKEVERMLSKSRVVERRNLKKNIELTVNPLLSTMRVPLHKIKVSEYEDEDEKDYKKKKEEVSNILLHMPYTSS